MFSCLGYAVSVFRLPEKKQTKVGIELWSLDERCGILAEWWRAGIFASHFLGSVFETLKSHMMLWTLGSCRLELASLLFRGRSKLMHDRHLEYYMALMSR